MSKLENIKNKLFAVKRDDEISGKDNLELLEEFSKHNQMPIFKGEVKHAYESDFLGYKDKCPKCQAPTEQMMSNFVYATQERSRLMAAPAGHFCTACPTVIIDDDIMKIGVDANRFWYGGVCAIETGYSDEPEMFETFNGEKPIMILDQEMATVGGIAQSVHQKNAPFDLLVPSRAIAAAKKVRQHKRKSTNRKKNRAAKNARKRNRRK